VIRAFVAAALVAALPLVAGAQVEGGVVDARPRGSPRWGSVDIGAERYRPNIDLGEAFTTPDPYRRTFGGGRGWMFRLGISKAITTRLGSLEAGVRTGYYQDTANALEPDGTRAPVETKFRIIPSSLSLTYRFDWHVERYRWIPLVPYVRATLERYNWWISDVDGEKESGATNGWSATGGLAFLLDILDPQSARDLDREAGVDHTYLFFEVTKSTIDDFGSSSSWDLSDEDFSYGGGLLFVF
jgi:hypothetical protein